MSKHIFSLRMNATYEPPDNAIATLEVEVLADGEWTRLDLNTLTPGFLIYVYAIFTCQHTFLRTNSTERKLALKSSLGNILVEASEDWHLEKIDVQFEVTLATGEPGDDDAGYIASRMTDCPVSRNLPQNITGRTTVEFRHG